YTIRDTKLRGVDSYGMFCSFSELGYPDKVVPVKHKDGVWILPPDTPVGADIVDYFGLNDATLDFEITPNRADCLSILGICRETAATFDLVLNYPFIGTKKELKEKLKNYISVEIRRPDLCNRYCCRVVKNVRIGESPWWMQRRLMHAGVRPINNIVDITNYVMLEYGQPIHAFDLSQIRGGKIIVDTAAEGETFTTLDGTERTLDGEMLMIKDAERSLCLAGVMGGLNSEIENDTTTILIESANFTSAGIRRTSKKLGLRTESSFRFEKGVDSTVAQFACDRVCSLIEAQNAGVSIRGMVDEYPRPYHSPKLEVRLTKVNKMLGLNLTLGEMLQIFHRLEIDTQGFSSVVVSCIPPTVRRDLLIEEDYAEEVARIYGYDKLPVTMPAMECQALKSPEQSFRDEILDTLTGLGLDEIKTYSFVSPKLADKVRDAADSPLRDQVKILNPLGEDTSVMRTALLPNLLEVLGRNSSRNNPRMVCFEIGNTFQTTPNEEGLPSESYALAVGGYGEDVDFFWMKGALEALFDKLGLPAREYVALTDDPTYHPGRTAAVYAGGELLGRLGELHPAVTENFGITAKTYGAELSVDALFGLARKDIVYKQLPKFP
ncbi:MAG: phenylalanine--tRNA ligase subunit beta, partial [Firmicutes bacterium]|nr:phenylalanine--tRNA ligase subunit beta [Bacillota bacterium]